MQSAPSRGCHICGSHQLVFVPKYPSFGRVTSDVKPWCSGGTLAVCESCKCAQAIVDVRWQNEAAAIYKAYALYHTSLGQEQRIFEQDGGRSMTRSERILRRLFNDIALPDQARFLDIGCGTGAFLSAINTFRPNWMLAGLEVHDRDKLAIEQIPGVERLYAGELKDVSGNFYVISMIHVLEHISQPRDYLAEVWRKLEPGGMLLIQVPDCEVNPFMYLVADHASHYFLSVLTEIMASVGFEIVAAANDWVPKEITIVAKKASDVLETRQINNGAIDSLSTVNKHVKWLDAQVQLATELASQADLGIFGTAIAGTWLHTQISERAAFFVDEDENRVGRSHLGKPILSPQQVPAGSHVYICAPPAIAKSIAVRLSHLPVQWHVSHAEY